jgi:hypothetical protein
VAETGETVVTLSATTISNTSGATDITVSYTLSKDQVGKYEGQTLVYCETVTCTADGKTFTVATHNDLTNESQSLYIASVSTTALSPERTHVISPDTPTTITDTVTYSNLVPNRTYGISFELYLPDGTPYQGYDRDQLGIDDQVTFTPTESSGSYDVTIPNLTLSNGDTVVIYETIVDTETGIVVASHEDPTDPNQTIMAYAENEMDTTLQMVGYIDDQRNDLKYYKAWYLYDIVEFQDEVSITNLIENGTYRLVSVLVDKDTGEEIARETTDKVTENQTVTFSAAYDGSSTDVVLTEDMIGHEIVAYEYLEMLINGEYQTVSAHEDIEDKDQTVEIKEYVSATITKKIALTDYESAVENGDSTTFTFFYYEYGTKTADIPSPTYFNLTFSGNADDDDKSFELDYNEDGEFTGYIKMSYTLDHCRTTGDEGDGYFIGEGTFTSADPNNSYMNPDWDLTSIYADGEWAYNTSSMATYNSLLARKAYHFEQGKENEVIFVNSYNEQTTSITIDKQFDGLAYDESEGDLTFIFHLTGTTNEGVTVDRYGETTFTAEYIKDNTNDKGVVSMSVVFDSLPEGTYSVEESYAVGYSLVEIKDEVNCEVDLGEDGYTATFIIDKKNPGYAVYVNAKSETLAGTKSVTNSFKTKKETM